MFNLLKGLLYENGAMSRTGLTALLFTFTFIIVSCYLAFHGTTWSHYETFAVVTTAGGAGVVVSNKYINSKNNSEEGKFPNKQVIKEEEK